MSVKRPVGIEPTFPPWGRRIIRYTTFREWVTAIWYRM